LLFASPVLVEVIHFPSGEPFSELFLLDSEKGTQNFPFNIVSGQSYTVYLGVGNHMGEATYYVCDVKLRNQTEFSPNSSLQIASSLPTLYEYRSVIQNGENQTIPLTFSISTTSPTKNAIVLKSITINDVEYNVDKIALYDSDNKGYYYQLFVELWAYNPAAGTIQYQNRWVYFWFNATSTAHVFP